VVHFLSGSDTDGIGPTAYSEECAEWPIPWWRGKYAVACKLA